MTALSVWCWACLRSSDNQSSPGRQWSRKADWVDGSSAMQLDSGQCPAPGCSDWPVGVGTAQSPGSRRGSLGLGSGTWAVPAAPAGGNLSRSLASDREHSNPRSCCTSASPRPGPKGQGQVEGSGDTVPGRPALHRKGLGQKADVPLTMCALSAPALAAPGPGGSAPSALPARPPPRAVPGGGMGWPAHRTLPMLSLSVRQGD